MERPSQGDILLLLVNRSRLSKSDIANSLNIHPAHLSKLFKSEVLTQKVRKGAASLFGVDESVFDKGLYPDVQEPDLQVINDETGIYDRHPKLDGLTAAQVLRYLEEKDKRHYEERARLLGIIENLTKK